MNTFYATFYSHFGAIRFKRLCDDRGIPAVLMPVPRSLSSSCGTCVRFEAEDFAAVRPYPEEMEQIARAEGAGFEVCYRAENA